MAAPVQPFVEADARRTRVIDVTLPISQADTTGTGSRIAYKPGILPTGAGWFGDHGVGLEILRAKWSLQWDDGVRSNGANAPFNNVGAGRNLGVVPAASGMWGSVTHSFRLLRNNQAAASYAQTAPALDAPAFSVFRVKHVVNSTLVQGTTNETTDTVSTVEEGEEWDYTDGSGHGLVVTNPELMITGMTLIMNSASARLVTEAGMVGIVTCKLVCRAIIVDVDTYHKCFH